MSDFDMIRALKQNDERLRQTEVKEVPGGIPGFTSFYDEGTFTPEYQGSGTAGAWTYSVQAGFWTRIGNRCLFNLSIQAATRPTPPTGAARVIGLPFNSVATANSHSPVAIDTIDVFTLTGTIVQLTGRVAPGTTRIELIENNGTGPSAAAVLAATGISATAFIRIAGHYMVA